MKITKIPYDLFGLRFGAVINLFLMTGFITFRHTEVSDVAYYVFNFIFATFLVLQIYSFFVSKMFKKGVQSYNAGTELLYPNIFQTVFLFMIFPALILLFLRWKLPGFSESVAWVISFVRSISLFSLLRKNLTSQFQQNEPFVHFLASKTHLIFHQKRFSVELEKSEIKQMGINSEAQTIMVETDEKRVFKMPYHYQSSFKLMRLNFSKENPDWFIEN